MNNLDAQLTDLEPMMKRSFGIGVIALALCLIGAYFDRPQFFRSYLMAYVFWLGIPVGCFGILMIYHLVGGTWGFVIQRPLEAAIRTFLVMALLCLSIFFCLLDFFVWARQKAVSKIHILKQKI